MEIFASYFWMAVAFINTFNYSVIWYKTKTKLPILWAIMWFHCALWGMTTSALNVPWVKVLNIIIIVNAATFGLIAGLIKLQEAINDKHI